MIKKLLLGVFTPLTMGVGLLSAAAPAQAGPSTYYFGGYDMRREVSYNCGTTGDVCWAVPWHASPAYVSYYNTQALGSEYIRDFIGGRINSWSKKIVAGQGLRIMCWQADSGGTIWLTQASAQIDDEGTPAFVIGWVHDWNVSLSTSDRLQYVPECGYYKT